MNSKITFFLLLCATFAGGCGAARPSNYYQLTVPGGSAPTAGPAPYAVTLLVGPIMASHLYREDHIVYTSGGQSMGLYLYQRWAEPPTEMIRDILLRELRDSNRFQSVNLWGSNTRGDYLLRGHLYDFREVSEGALVGRVTLELELENTHTGATVWTHFYTHDEPVNSKSVAAVVAALNQDTQQGLGEFRTSLEQYFAAHPLAAPAPAR